MSLFLFLFSNLSEYGRLSFLPDFPGAMFIWESAFIADFIVVEDKFFFEVSHHSKCPETFF